MQPTPGTAALAESRLGWQVEQRGGVGRSARLERDLPGRINRYGSSAIHGFEAIRALSTPAACLSNLAARCQMCAPDVENLRHA